MNTPQEYGSCYSDNACSHILSLLVFIGISIGTYFIFLRDHPFNFQLIMLFFGFGILGIIVIKVFLFFLSCGGILLGPIFAMLAIVGGGVLLDKLLVHLNLELNDSTYNPLFFTAGALYVAFHLFFFVKNLRLALSPSNRPAQQADVPQELAANEELD